MGARQALAPNLMGARQALAPNLMGARQALAPERMGARQALAPNRMGARQALAPKPRRSGLPVGTDPGRISGGCGWGTTPPGDGGLMTMDADRLDGRVALVTGA